MPSATQGRSPRCARGFGSSPAITPRLHLGCALAGTRPAEALELFLEVVRSGSEALRDEARQAMLETFELVGARSELAERFRALLARELYK